MTFSPAVLTILTYGALALAAGGGITLIVLLIRDARHGKIW